MLVRIYAGLTATYKRLYNPWYSRLWQVVGDMVVTPTEINVFLWVFLRKFV